MDAEKNIKTKLKEAFLSLEEEEMFKYFKIFKSTLSGTIGKNLLNMEFPLSQESEGGTQEFLLKLRNSELKNEALIDEFYEKVMADYLYPENYYIILIHGPTMYRDALRIIWIWTMLPITSMNLSSAASAR